jgi:hypothetical protein
LAARLLFLKAEARFFAESTILKLPHTHDITPPIAAPGTDCGGTKEVQMADGLIPKPPSLSAAGSRSKRVRSGTNGPACYTTSRRDFAADLLQMQRQSIADATICWSWRQPRTPARCVSTGQAGVTRFPGSRAGANPCRSTWSQPQAHDRPSPGALGGVHRRRFQTDALPERTGFWIAVGRL